MQNTSVKHSDESSSNQEDREFARTWARKLLAKSPLKQKKMQMITRLIGDTGKLSCLDIGSDNGVVSLLLRDRGGIWSSADLIPETVEAIRSLVGERVDQIDGKTTPYKDNEFDLVVIVDFLEHIETDREFVSEIRRILKPDGRLITNVPNPKEGWLRRLRYRLGQTDEEHGHIRPGYTPDSLAELLQPHFTIVRHKGYSGFFPEFIDMCITYALDVLKKGGRSKKGSVVTSADLKKLQKSFKMFSLVYPVVKAFVLLDYVIPWTHKNMLIAECKAAGS